MTTLRRNSLCINFIQVVNRREVKGENLNGRKDIGRQFRPLRTKVSSKVRLEMTPDQTLPWTYFILHCRSTTRCDVSLPDGHRFWCLCRVRLPCGYYFVRIDNFVYHFRSPTTLTPHLVEVSLFSLASTVTDCLGPLHGNLFLKFQETKRRDRSHTFKTERIKDSLFISVMDSET